MLSKNKRGLKFAYDKGYRCDNDGNVISPISGKFLTPIYNKRGYYEFGFRDSDGKKRLIPIRYLQAYMKFGEEALYAEIITHKNGDTFDNSYDNIILSTVNGRFQENPTIRLTASSYEEILSKYNRKDIYDYFIQSNRNHGKTIMHFGLKKHTVLDKLIKEFEKEK